MQVALDSGCIISLVAWPNLVSCLALPLDDRSLPLPYTSHCLIGRIVSPGKAVQRSRTGSETAVEGQRKVSGKAVRGQEKAVKGGERQ